MSQNVPEPLNPEPGLAATTCKNCHSPMPMGLRFCRNCGYRLGEGSAEYTETVRFNGTTAASNGAAAMPISSFGAGAGQMAPYAGALPARRKKRMSGMTWIFVAVIAFFAVAVIASQAVRQVGRGINAGIQRAATRSYAGVNSFDTAEGGVTFDAIEAPGSPADKAGLVGGDIITTFDGQTVTEDDQMMDLLRRTPIGKTVDVVYIRDGETKTTKLTTISEGELSQLSRAFTNRPEGRGKLGIDDQETVEIPGTKLHGVRLGEVTTSLPADMAGLKSGDVVIQMGDIPIRTAAELNYRIQVATPYKPLDFVIMRGSERMVITVKMGHR
jgi:S1-C subfamily serine protease